ncbi:uncharacterized protein LOC119558473 [Drosophila subpulchrella]|uniref:uncharacterized protein LOC119555848 n=1 Tax=Drosophila subpulchrella TaxID=1486046 RepID=UPI0018A132CB|nr:uncharacterized protein LOC119555848 [Drosophila subpulchrella]XP_037727913.1 uncharacterized protein LOC119558473 [Drosophila subpulchrella]
MPRRSKVEFRTPKKKSHKKRRRNSKCFDSAPVPVERPEINEPVQKDSPSELLSSCAPISEPWPDQFCLEGVVLYFGIQGNTEPVHMKSDAELMPPPKSWIVLKARPKVNAVESHEMIAKNEDDESKDDESKDDESKDDESEDYKEIIREMQLKDPTPVRLGSVPPRPQDEAATEGWLQDCNKTISEQLLLLVIKESAKPSSADPESVYQMIQMNQMNQMKPRSSKKSGIVVGAAKNVWHVSYLLRNADFERSLELYTWKYGDPEANRLLAKWKEVYGSETAKKLDRTLVLAPLPVRQEQSLQKSGILGRPAERQSETVRLRLEMKVCKLFCTLQMHRHVDLETAVKSLDNAIYRSDVGVIEVRFEVGSQVGWIWDNGTVMIIDGLSKDDLADALQEIVAKTMGKENFQLDPGHRLLHLRLNSGAFFPWSVDLQEFAKAHSLSSDLCLHETNFAHYVNKNMPGVAARLQESGLIKVYAMSPGEGDEMVRQMYLISAQYRKC